MPVFWYYVCSHTRLRKMTEEQGESDMIGLLEPLRRMGVAEQRSSNPYLAWTHDRFVMAFHKVTIGELVISRKGQEAT